MGRHDDGCTTSDLLSTLISFLRGCLFRILSVGPMPNHVAFIMDGNRRYAKKQNLEVGAGHRDGFSSLMSILKCCYELGVKYVSIYAFSIENFKRKPDEVQNLMDLMLEKIEALLKEESIVNQYGIRVYFVGNLKLLSERVGVAADKVMKATAKNEKAVLLVCVAYTSGDEIVHAVQESCKHKLDKIQGLRADKALESVVKATENFEKANGLVIPKHQKTSTLTIEELGACKNEDSILVDGRIHNFLQGEDYVIKTVDIEEEMYMSVAPAPDILIRSSGETRLSNFLLWQTSNCLLYSPAALWPEIGLRHLVCAVLNFQRNYSYLEKKRKQF